jgi:hypothetical protein
MFNQNYECSVCLTEINDSDKCITDCNHEFCKQCLDKWFDSKKLSCPLCRKDINYFQHQGNNTRVVCVIKNQNIPRINTDNRFIIMTKKLYYIYNIITSISLISSCLTGYLFYKCDNYSY